jgi:hypothetical protein
MVTFIVTNGYRVKYEIKSDKTSKLNFIFNLNFSSCISSEAEVTTIVSWSVFRTSFAKPPGVHDADTKLGHAL